MAPSHLAHATGCYPDEHSELDRPTVSTAAQFTARQSHQLRRVSQSHRRSRSTPSRARHGPTACRHPTAMAPRYSQRRHLGRPRWCGGTKTTLVSRWHYGFAQPCGTTLLLYLLMTRLDKNISLLN